MVLRRSVVRYIDAPIIIVSQTLALDMAVMMMVMVAAMIEMLSAFHDLLEALNPQNPQALTAETPQS